LFYFRLWTDFRACAARPDCGFSWSLIPHQLFEKSRVAPPDHHHCVKQSTTVAVQWRMLNCRCMIIASCTMLMNV